MACEHKHVKSVNCVLYCMDCGAKVEAPIQTTEQKPSTTGDKPRRKTKKGA